VNWFEIVVFVALLCMLIWVSYTAGRLDVVGKLPKMLEDWAERFERDRGRR
jgi:hypothetical protein